MLLRDLNIIHTRAVRSGPGLKTHELGWDWDRLNDRDNETCGMHGLRSRCYKHIIYYIVVVCSILYFNFAQAEGEDM